MCTSDTVVSVVKTIESQYGLRVWFAENAVLPDYGFLVVGCMLI